MLPVKYRDNKGSVYTLLTERYQLITEYYHKLSFFNKVIDDIIEYIKDNYNLKNFYSGWVIDTDKKKCVKKSITDNVNEYPIYVEYIYDTPNLDANVKEKKENPDYVCIQINANFLKCFTAKTKEELLSSAQLVDEDGESIIDTYEEELLLKYFKRYHGQDFSKILKGTLHHEFIHVYHGYCTAEPYVLTAQKNNIQNYTIYDKHIPENVKNVLKISINSFIKYDDVLYLNAPTEQEARINGVAGYLDSLDIVQIKQMFEKWKRVSGISNLSIRNKIDCFLADENVMHYNMFVEYNDIVQRQMAEDYEKAYITPTYHKAFICLAYRLEKGNLLHIKPKIDDNFILSNYNSILKTDDGIKLANQITTNVIAYLTDRMIEFEYKIYKIIYNFIVENNL